MSINIFLLSLFMSPPLLVHVLPSLPVHVLLPSPPSSCPPPLSSLFMSSSPLLPVHVLLPSPPCSCLLPSLFMSSLPFLFMSSSPLLPVHVLLPSPPCSCPPPLSSLFTSSSPSLPVHVLLPPPPFLPFLFLIPPFPSPSLTSTSLSSYISSFRDWISFTITSKPCTLWFIK